MLILVTTQPILSKLILALAAPRISDTLMISGSYGIHESIQSDGWTSSRRAHPYYRTLRGETNIIRTWSTSLRHDNKELYRRRIVWQSVNTYRPTRMSSNTFSDEEQTEFWDDFDNLQKAKIVRWPSPSSSREFVRGKAGPNGWQGLEIMLF